MEIYFITSNRHKLAEANHALGTKLKHKNLEIPEMQSTEVKEVAVEKARSAYEAAGHEVVVEDTGVYIKQLNGFPGALAKWFLKSLGGEAICRLLDNYEDRSAYMETCVVAYDGKETHIFCGRLKGSIAKKPRGTNGFGYDSIFVPAGKNTTLAEMDISEKSRISARGMAFKKLKKYLA